MGQLQNYDVSVGRSLKSSKAGSLSNLHTTAMANVNPFNKVISLNPAKPCVIVKFYTNLNLQSDHSI